MAPDVERGYGLQSNKKTKGNAVVGRRFAADQGGQTRHYQRRRPRGRGLQEDGFTRHQPVAFRARGYARASPGGDRRTRLRPGPAGARPSLPPVFPDRDDLRPTQPDLCRQYAAGHLGRAQGLRLRTGRPPVQPELPDPAQGHSRLRRASAPVRRHHAALGVRG
ncbi:hypothetical protein D3C86_1290790 [compost metagenome]